MAFYTSFRMTPEIFDKVLLSDERKWKHIAEEFEELWQFPHCLGGLNGKHIMIQAPKNSGSLFLNYKKHFSVVLQTVVDANYKFCNCGHWSIRSTT